MCRIEKPMRVIAPAEAVPSEAICRRLGFGDVSAVARIHCAAYPNGILTAFGERCVMQYYSWHMEGKHAVSTIGLECGDKLIGFCVLLRYNDFGGFLRRGLPIVSAALMRSPWLALQPLFVKRLRGGMSLLVGKRRAKAEPGTVRILSIALEPAYQGHGLGQTLLRAAAETALRDGASALALTVHPDNHRAVRAYQRDGWERTLVNGAWQGAMRKSLSTVTTPPVLSI
jgi:ribosomal protein S18 acetylase RimI-like enzyme